MEVLRILHIFNGLNRGGMESRIMDVYRHIDKNKYQFDFYVESGEKGAFVDEILAMGGRVYYMSGSKCMNLPNFKEFKHFITSHKYKIVFAYNQWSGWYLKIAKEAGVPFRVANARTSLQTKSLKNSIKNLVKLNSSKHATHCFAVSKLAGDWLFGENHDYNILPNAIDVNQYKFSSQKRARVRRQLDLEKNYIVVHVGNFRHEKNHPYLLDVFSEICKIRPEAKLVLIGKGDISMFSEQINGLNIDKNIIHLGVREDVSTILQGGDVFIFPSFYEGFPGAVLEAETSGLPCIIADTITSEVVLTRQVKRIPLSKGACFWAQMINTFVNIERENAWKDVLNAGYDINDLTDRLEQLFDAMT